MSLEANRHQNDPIVRQLPTVGSQTEPGERPTPRRWSMMTGTRARSYHEMVDALATEGLPALQDTLAGLGLEDWQRPTLLQPPDP